MGYYRFNGQVTQGGALTKSGFTGANLMNHGLEMLYSNELEWSKKTTGAAACCCWRQNRQVAK